MIKDDRRLRQPGRIACDRILATASLFSQLLPHPRDAVRGMAGHRLIAEYHSLPVERHVDIPSS